MRVPKRWRLLPVAVLVMTALCSCGWMDGSIPAEQMRVQALEYLGERYCDEFTAMGYSGPSWAYDYASITFSSKEFPDAVVEVRATRKEDGSFVFKDNYYQCCMMDEAVDFCKNSADLGQVCIKVRFPDSVWSDALQGAETLQDWAAKGTCQMDVFVISAGELLPEVQNAFLEALVSNKITGSVVFLTTDAEDLLAEKTLDEILNSQSELVTGQKRYFIRSDFAIETD